jgi:hypothetical protein
MQIAGILASGMNRCRPSVPTTTAAGNAGPICSVPERSIEKELSDRQVEEFLASRAAFE